MRAFEEVIREARLLASSPELVASCLEERAGRLAENGILDEGDEELEAALLARGHPLIDLALAQFCRHSKTAKALFFREPANQAVRFAVLTNQVVGGSLFGCLPTNLFDQSKERLAAYLAAADLNEITALFQNPKVEDSFLRDYLEGDECWKALNEDRQIGSLQALHRNPRIKTPYNSDFMDGYAEYSYGAVFHAAWKLAVNSPVNQRWATALNWLYDSLEPNAFSIDDPLDVAKRWFPQTPEDIEHDQKRKSSGFLSSFQGVRTGLAKLALSKDSSLKANLLASEDIAFRSAIYAHSDLTAMQINQAYENDGELAFEQLVHNKVLWRRADTRQALHDVAWAVVRNDKQSDLMAANIFNGVRDRFAKEHPDWFRDDEEFQPEPSSEAATKGDIEALASIIATAPSSIQQLQGLLKTINSRLGWVWWFALGALVTNFGHF